MYIVNYKLFESEVDFKNSLNVTREIIDKNILLQNCIKITEGMKLAAILSAGNSFGEIALN